MTHCCISNAYQQQGWSTNICEILHACEWMNLVIWVSDTAVTVYKDCSGPASNPQQLCCSCLTALIHVKPLSDITRMNLMSISLPMSSNQRL